MVLYGDFMVHCAPGRIGELIGFHGILPAMVNKWKFKQQIGAFNGDIIELNG